MNRPRARIAAPSTSPPSTAALKLGDTCTCYRHSCPHDADEACLRWQAQMKSSNPNAVKIDQLQKELQDKGPWDSKSVEDKMRIPKGRGYR